MLAPLIMGQKDISPSTPSLPYYTGPNGLFNLPGVNKSFISTIIQPTGLAAALPAFGTVYNNPEFGYITGFAARTGVNPEGVCDDAPVPGPVITCLQTAHFGRYRLDTRPIELNRVGLLRNAADPIDFSIFNGPLAPFLGGLTPSSAYDAGSAMLNPKMEMVARMGEVAREMGMTLMKQLWFGDPTNASAGGGYDEFPGLNILLGVNKVDARTGQTCTSLRSDIKPFNGWQIGADNANNVRLMTALQNIVWTRKFIASRTNMGSVRSVFVMRENLFREISAMWPCLYNTTGCVGMGADSFSLSVMAKDNITDRDNMRAGRYLMVDGERIDVIFDDAIPEESSGNGCYTSDIYYIPLSVRGGTPVTYWEYMDYNQGPMQAASQAGYGHVFRTDGGRYFWWTKPNNNVCVQLGVKTEPRIIFLTPHLAGRITDVGYCSNQHAPDPFSGDLYAGTQLGVASRTQTGLYRDDSPTTPATYP